MKTVQLRFTVVSLIFILVVNACTALTPEPTATVPPTLTLTPVPPTSTITLTLTPTPIRWASVNRPADCYSGPGSQYDKVASLEAGARVKLIGESSDQTYWIVTTADAKECWLAKEALNTTVGGIVGLPQLVPPATPTLGPPAAPSDLTVKNSCRLALGVLIADFVITWTDNANNEDGYIVYKDGNEIKRLAANTTQFGDSGYGTHNQFTYYAPPAKYAIAAFNAAGESAKVEIIAQLKCPR